METIRCIEPSGHPLGDLCTLSGFQDSFMLPQILDCIGYSPWVVEGKKEIATQTCEKAREILPVHQVRETDRASREGLDALAERRKIEISPSLA